MASGRRKPGSSTLGYDEGTPFDGQAPDVLVIDPDTISRERFRADLKAHGYRVVVLAGHAGLGRINKKGPPRVILANVDSGTGMLIAYGLTEIGDDAPALVLAGDPDQPPIDGVTRVVAEGDRDGLVEATCELLEASSS
jgi:hypothetical protein